MIDFLRDLFTYWGWTGQDNLEIVLISLAAINLLGLLVQSLSSWIRDSRLANRQKQIEIGLRNLQTSLDVKSHITRAQFDVEFDIYQKIWKTIFEARISVGIFEATLQSRDLFGTDEIENDTRRMYRDRCVKALNSFTQAMDETSAFYPEYIYLEMIQLRRTFNDAIDKFDNKVEDPAGYLVNCQAARANVNNEVKRISAVIRERLAGISIVG